MITILHYCKIEILQIQFISIHCVNQTCKGGAGSILMRAGGVSDNLPSHLHCILI
jgi:hypothetical protein